MWLLSLLLYCRCCSLQMMMMMMSVDSISKFHKIYSIFDAIHKYEISHHKNDNNNNDDNIENLWIGNWASSRFMCYDDDDDDDSILCTHTHTHIHTCAYLHGCNFTLMHDWMQSEVHKLDWFKHHQRKYIFPQKCMCRWKIWCMIGKSVFQKISRRAHYWNIFGTSAGLKTLTAHGHGALHDTTNVIRICGAILTFCNFSQLPAFLCNSRTYNNGNKHENNKNEKLSWLL